MEKTYSFNLRSEFYVYRLFKKICRDIIMSELVYPGMVIVTVRQGGAENSN